jgi:hypothetical protein
MFHSGLREAKSVSVPRDDLPNALTRALERALLKPLIDIILDYAREANWHRATVEPFFLATEQKTLSSLLVDTARRRVLWLEDDTGRLQSIAVDDLKQSSPEEGAPRAQPRVSTVAGPLDDVKTVADAAHCLAGPSSVAIESVSHWPAGTDAAAVSSATALLATQVGAGALWVTDEATHTVIRIDEKTGAACVVAGAAKRVLSLVPAIRPDFASRHVSCGMLPMSGSA